MTWNWAVTTSWPELGVIGMLIALGLASSFLSTNGLKPSAGQAMFNISIYTALILALLSSK